MRRKKNIILTLEILISFLRNLIGHFIGKQKIITLSFIILILSLVNIINTSALNYESNVGVGFTFNPTLSVSISPSNLIIDNLTPGTTSDSNTINISVATNAAYGYTLSAIVNGDNSNLTHTNGANAFSNITTNASLSSLTTDDTWGYSYRNNLAPTPTWSSYSGLSNSVSKVLFNTDNNSSGSIDFKIAAKASETQPSGTYTGIINFAATTKPMPKTIQDIAYMQTFAELDTVDLASVKNSMILNNAYMLKDIRDEKEYYVTRLEDGNVWMTQNLDLDLDSSKTYTHYDTDLGWNDPNNLGLTATWQPIHSTIDFTDGAVGGWVDSNTEPYSANPGDIYYYTSSSNAADTKYNSLQECQNANHTDCGHYQVGNYYNFSAGIASNNSASGTNNGPNSICPAGWRLPDYSTNEFAELLVDYNVISDISSENYIVDGNNRIGLNNIRNAPIYFVRSGEATNLNEAGVNGKYWYSKSSRGFVFYYDAVFSAGSYGKRRGFSVRCLAR